jgi:LysM repeat protein
MIVLWSKINRGLLLLVFCFMVLSFGGVKAGGVWGTRPLISYFALTASLEAPLRAGARLSADEYSQVEAIAYQEAESLLRLIETTQNIVVSEESASLAKKRSQIEASGYNHQVDNIIYQTDQRLRSALSLGTYTRLIDWIERRWPVEQAMHGRPHTRFHYSDLGAVRSYQVFGTRYESKGAAYTAALPDKCLKFANGGLHTCDGDGYVPGAGYAIAISYKKGAGVTVGESGPWNIDDNFWATLGDPQPRRMFADLALGMPEAQAAYFNGYNGGLDQYGRKVTAPFAIDLAFEVGNDIGLPPKKNDWITVSFLWTADWGVKPGKGAAETPGAPTQQGVAPAATSNVISTVKTSTPAADGSITHKVQAGETLWTIAVAYNIRVAQIQFLNNLGQTVIIYEGQNLIIKEPGPTWTPLPPSQAGVTPDSTATTLTTPEPPRQTGESAMNTSVAVTHSAIPSPASATRTRITPTQGVVTQTTIKSTHTPVPAGSKRNETGFAISDTGLLIGALALAGGGALLFGLGLFFSKKEKKGEAE